jgi:flagellin
MGAMVALDTLKGINKNLGMVQNEISTGKSINSAKDNAAIWSISTVMETDVAGFEQIGNSLNLGSATVGVARTASEEIVSELQDIRDDIIAAQESNVDRTKIQTDIDESVKQIQSIVGGAQFNGQNLLNESGSISILSSLDRSASGVEAKKITVDKANLSTAAGTTDTLASGDAGGLTLASGASLTVAEGDGATDDASAVTVTTAAAGEAEGNVYEFTFAGETINYTATATDTQDSIATAIAAAMNGVASLPTGVSDIKATGGVVSMDIADPGVGNPVNVGAVTTDASTKVDVAGGNLEALTTLSVADDTAAAEALTNIEALLTSAIDAAAQFGSKQKRIDNQINFVSSLGDSLKAGVSTLTDANLEEASARLQALQVQQQLGVQALSIANQAPQSLLSLFR